MAFGRRRKTQGTLFVTSDEIARAPGHPFYSRLEEVFNTYEFDSFCYEPCRALYADGVGRPGLALGVYFRLLMLGGFSASGKLPGEWLIRLAFGNLPASA